MAAKHNRDMKQHSIDHEVMVIGAGPTGLTLAAELALAGVDVAVFDRRADQTIAGARAGGLHPRTLELFDQRGIVDRFVSRGQKYPIVLFPGSTLSIHDLPSRHNYWLALWQEEIERILAGWAAELEVRTVRGVDVVDVSQGAFGVIATLADGRVHRAKYLVGCDGGRSLVRKKAAIEFPGWDPSISYLIAEAEMTSEPAWGVRHGAMGTHAIGKLDDGKRVRAVLVEDRLRQSETPDVEDLRAALRSAYGTDFGVQHVAWLSRFTDGARQAASYRNQRILLAGDAAHVHSPVGGQGLNLGVQDAMNLGWKLAQVVKGISAPSLLDTYQAERHPVTARVLRTTLAITALSRGDERTGALRETLSELMRLDSSRHWFAAMQSGLDACFENDKRHPQLGRRMPDLDIVVGSESRRVFSLLHAAKPVLLNLGEPGRVDLGAWSDRVTRADGRFTGTWTLPALGPVPPPAAVLIRPDGQVAWVEDSSEESLPSALATWCGGAPLRQAERAFRETASA
jgi:2-polyprenyl-6-methoxyphenol hydroxylase-like FAD-dependent oxidoreductase